jgi:hypothetical protein
LWTSVSVVQTWDYSTARRLSTSNAVLNDVINFFFTCKFEHIGNPDFCPVITISDESERKPALGTSKNCFFRLVINPKGFIEVTRRGKTLRLRRIGYRDAETGNRYQFLTNYFRLSAKTIADIYKDRWQIELFFREIKQNLRIKSFVGNTENAVLIQINTYLTVYLILAYQKFMSKIGLSVQQIFQIALLNLLGTETLEDLLTPKRRMLENPYNLSLVSLVA